MKHTLEEIRKISLDEIKRMLNRHLQLTSIQDLPFEWKIISDLVGECERLREVLNKIAYPTEWDSLTGGELLPIWFKELAREALETPRR